MIVPPFFCRSERPNSIIIIGDSTAARASIALSSLFKGCTDIKSQGRCDYDKYYEIPYDYRKFRKKIPKSFGPIAYGKNKRGCQDCSGCGAWKKLCNNSTFFVEFIGIEFAMDVEYPTVEYDTTQESIIYGYLKEQRYDNPLIYFNTGLHDAKSRKTIVKKSADYAKNLQKYFDIILKVFSREQLVWLTTTGVRSSKQPKEWRKILSNRVIENFNKISLDLAATHGIQVIDLFYLSKNSTFYQLNYDGVHYGSHEQPYYMEVAQTILTHFVNKQQRQEN